MDVKIAAPLLSRIKSWQLFCLGVTGWVTLYSVAIICWGSSSFVIGNTQGGCFAAAMTLAGVEVRRYQKGNSVSKDPLQWVGNFTTEELNLILAQNLQQQNLLVEAPHPVEAEMGFGLRAVMGGRTLVYETARWKEPVIDLSHAKATDENRNQIRADFAIIVGAGTPDEDTKTFISTHPVKLLVGQELKDLFPAEPPPEEVTEPQPNIAAEESRPLPPEENA